TAFCPKKGKLVRIRSPNRSPKWSLEWSLATEQGYERACVEHRAQRGNLPVLHLIPLRNERRSGGGVRDHVVEHADVLAVYEDLLKVNALDDRGQPFDRFEILLSGMERIEWSVEGHIVSHQVASRSEISRAERSLVAFDDFTR